MTDLREPGSRAILLGAGTYRFKQLPKVPAVTDTVNDLRAALIERCGMDRGNITDLRDSTDVREVMEVVAAGAEQTTGILVVYYVGHGLTGQSGDLYLSVGGTDPTPGYPREHSAIPYAHLARLLEQSPALAKVVILDCCFSGRALPRNDSAGRGPGVPTGPEGGAVITSAAREEHALAPENEKYTVFTGQLLKLLDEGYPGGPPDLTFRVACQYLKETLAVDFPRPQWVFDGAADNIVLTGNGAYEPPTLTITDLLLPQAITQESPTEVTQSATASQYAASPRTAATIALKTVPQSAKPVQPSTAPPNPAPEVSQPSVRQTVNGTGRPFRDRRVRRVLAAISALLLAGAAGLTAFLLTRPDHPPGGTPRPSGSSRAASPAASPTGTGNVAATTPPTCASGSITLVGGAFGPIAGRAATSYKGLCKHDKISIVIKSNNGSDSAYGVNTVSTTYQANHQNAASMMAMYDGMTSLAKGLTGYPVGVLIYSVIAHKGAIAQSSITVGELRQLYTEPGGWEGKVGAGFKQGSGTRQAFLGLLTATQALPRNCPAPTGKAVPLTACTEDAGDKTLAFVNGTPNAVGYLAIDSQEYRYPARYPQTSVLDIGGYAPTTDNVRIGHYGFVAVEHLYLPPNPTALARDFLAYLPQFLATYAKGYGHQETDYTTCANVPAALAYQCKSPALPAPSASGT
jgi:hypothetical protein